MDSDILSRTWRNFKNRALDSESNWDTERGINDQYTKYGDMDKHPDHEQRSHSIDNSTNSHAQREPVNVLPGNEISILNPDSKYNQDSALGVGSDDMISRQQKTMNPHNKAPINFKPPPPSTRKSISEGSGIEFFGDSNTASYTPRSRTLLDQDSLHRGFISTLPSAQKGRRSSAIKHEAPITDITNVANKPRDESVSTSAYKNVPIGSSALKSNDMKLSTRSSSDEYNNYLADRNDMSKSDSYSRSTTENRHDLSSRSFNSEINRADIPYAAKELPSNFPSNRTEYAMKPKEKLDISTGDSSHDQATLGQYAINTHEKTHISPGSFDMQAKDKITEQSKGDKVDGSVTESEDESSGKGLFSFATSAAAAVGASAAAAGAVVSNALFGKGDNGNAVETHTTTASNQHFSLDNSPSVWKSEDLPSDHSNLYETPIHWGQSSSFSAPKSQKEAIPHRAYVVPNHDSMISGKDSQLGGPSKSIENKIPSLSNELATQDKTLSKNKAFSSQIPVSELAKEGSTTCAVKDMPRPNELITDNINLEITKLFQLDERNRVPYHVFDVPTREQVMLKDAITTPPPSEYTKPELVDDSPYNVPTKGQVILEKSMSDTPPPQELKNISGILPNQQLYTRMPLPDPLKLDQERPIPQPDMLESIEGDTRDKYIPLMQNTVLSDKMPGSFAYPASEDKVSDFEHPNDEIEPAIHGQHACFHTMDIVPPEITPKQVTHSFCGDIKEPSIHGQTPSFYLDEDSSASNTMKNKNLNNGKDSIGPLHTSDKNKSPISGSSGNSNQYQPLCSGLTPTKGITRELKGENPIPKNQGINHDGVTYRDFASQGAYDPVISMANSNALKHKGNKVADDTVVEHDIYGNPLRDYEQSKAADSPLRPDGSNSESAKDNGYILGGQTPIESKSPNYQSGYPSAKSAAGAAVAMGASVGASKLFTREKKNQVVPVASNSYNMNSDNQNLEPVSSAPLTETNKQNGMLGFNKLEKESNESVSSTRATTGKIIPDTVYIKRNEDEVKPRATYSEELPDAVAQPLITQTTVVEEDTVHPTSVPIRNAAKLPPANKDYPAKVDQKVSTTDNERRKSKGAIVLDKLRRFSLGGRKSSESPNDYIIQDVVDRRPSAAEIYKNQQLKAQSENTSANPSMKVKTTKIQTETVSPLKVTTEGQTTEQTTKPINIANEVPYYVEDPRLSSNGHPPQVDNNQKISRIPGVNNMYPAGTKSLGPGKPVYVRLNDNHTTPQIRQVMMPQAEPLDGVTNVEQDVSLNVTNTATTGTTGFVPGTANGMNDNVSFGTYISGQLENRRGSIQKTVGKLVKNEDMQEKGDLKKVSGKIKIKAYQENRRSSN